MQKNQTSLFSVEKEPSELKMWWEDLRRNINHVIEGLYLKLGFLPPRALSHMEAEGAKTTESIFYRNSAKTPELMLSVESDGVIFVTTNPQYKGAITPKNQLIEKIQTLFSKNLATPKSTLVEFAMVGDKPLYSHSAKTQSDQNNSEDFRVVKIVFSGIDNAGVQSIAKSIASEISGVVVPTISKGAGDRSVDKTQRFER